MMGDTPPARYAREGENMELHNAVSEEQDFDEWVEELDVTTKPSIWERKDVTYDQGSFRTDQGNAERLAEMYGHNLLLCSELGSDAWLVWDGRRFARTAESKHQLSQMAADTARAMYYAAGRVKDHDQRKAMAQWALRSEDSFRVKAMVQQAAALPEVRIRLTGLDSDPSLLNVLNGTIELQTGELQEHRREDRITKLAGVEFDPDAVSGEWTRFLEESLPDPEVRAFVQRAAGYSLCGDGREHVIYFIHGPGGTGKTTFLEAFKAVLGEYSTTASWATFQQAVGEGRGPRSDITRLAGARMVAASEARENLALDAGMLKTLTGGDTVVARELYKAEVEFTPQFTLWLASNNRPSLPDDDSGMWRRLVQIPFTEVVPDDRKDPGLQSRLRDPGLSGPAILRWALEGLRAYRELGLEPPSAVMNYTAEYRAEVSPLADFLQDCCVLGDGLNSTSAALWEAYAAYARANLVPDELGRQAFRNRLRTDARFKPARFPGDKRGYFGIGLVSEGAADTGMG